MGELLCHALFESKSRGPKAPSRGDGDTSVSVNIAVNLGGRVLGRA
jgi:hypothetical protein